MFKKSSLKKITLLLAAMPFLAFANGNSNGGKVVHVASVEGALLFKIAGNTESNRPACATTGRFSVRNNSSHARLVMAAFNAGKPLANVRGEGICSIWGNSEDVKWIEVCPLTGC